MSSEREADGQRAAAERAPGRASDAELPWPAGSNEPLQLVVSSAQAGRRLDRVVAEALGDLGRAALKALFVGGCVWVGAPGEPWRRGAKGDEARAGELVVVRRCPETDPVARDLRALPDADAPLVVVLETEAIVVVDKPAGQPSAPLQPDEHGTLANALLGHYPEMAAIGFSPREPGICHRLDNDTSGLLLAARTEAAFAAMTNAIRAGELHKRYLLVCPSPGLPERGTIELPLAPHPRDARRVLACAHPRDEARLQPRPAVTVYRVLERSGDAALVEARAPRALRHQIRAHFAAIGHPIHGDRLYGSTAARELGRQALHASVIGWAGGAGVDAFKARSALPAGLRALLAG